MRSALEDVGLDPARFGERYPHQLSGGQRQRVAIAAALVLEPEGLICDEPVSMLDASVQAQILAVLLELQRRRELALLFITHDLSLAWTLCDRIVVMYLGRVVEQGTAVDVIERPQHPYTQALVSAIPVPTPGGGGQRELLSGELPDATDVPPGCRFHPRCPKRFEPCDTVDPPLLRAGGRDQLAACLLHDPEPGPRRWTRRLAMGSERWRDIAGRGRALEPGPRNAITDVPGVRSATRSPRAASRPASPWSRRRRCRRRRATAVVNGMGELTGKIEIDERGTMETPVYLCGTHAVGVVHHAAVLASGRGPGNFVLPVVGECDDSWRADSRRVTDGDVERALEALGTDVAEGTVGAGTGMMCFDFPGGIGTASRVVGDHHVGVLLLCNFGDRERLDLLGTRLEPPRSRRAGGLVHLGLRHRRPRSALISCGAWRCGRCSGWSGSAPTATTARARSASRSRPPSGRSWPATTSTRTSRPPGRRRRSRSTTASSPPSPRELRDGTMQEPFPIELVRELARARDARR